MLTVLLQDRTGKIDISLEDVLKDERAENSRLRLRMKELQDTDAKAEAARDRAAESQAEAAAAAAEVDKISKAMAVLTGLPDAG